MKVKIGNYPSYITPYHIAEWLCFWVPNQKNEYGIDEKPEWVHNFGEWLAYGKIEPDPTPENPIQRRNERKPTWFYRLIIWLCNSRKRKISVHIDRWDTWSMDSTLAHIILPMLKQLKKEKHGSPHVEDKDVPKHLRSTSAKPLTEEEQKNGTTDEYFHARWDWVLDEMIFAFENVLDDDWQSQFYSGETDWYWKGTEFNEKGKAIFYEIKNGPNHTFKVDEEGMKAYHERMKNGLRLFGKYYENLWS